ncbi:AAA family ATPase [Streptococcus sp. CSL10205-OR2]|uniref:AAA family ATPase n=1 Tax=Streptococcus sp. CSL10205-OR2 TaxID=2980558 RepID=UPI0021D8C55B|nr:AAA family ATPase [Streptococcus sp. CSL10205-OR2]MCU9533273.1 AAA family ATPase [Streptococcus sp. CSL10205-OR2]
MISSILIKNIGSYDENGVCFEKLREINFVYGSNGSGKTTISNFIYDKTDTKYNDCSMNWTNDQPLDVLVYNKNFRERNFGKGKLNGVFTLGEATAEDIRTIESKTDELKRIKEEGIKKKETLEVQKKKKEELENQFRDTTWQKVYKKNETYFKEAFKGFLQKESFKNKLIQESESNTEKLETLENLKEKAETIFGERPQRIEPINLISFDKVLKIEENKIWGKIIVGKADVDIAKLIQKININDWVNQGRDYIEDDICPFCQQQTITEEFKKQLEIFFDESYLNDIELIKSLKEEYSNLTQNIINQLNAIEEKQKILSNTKLDIDQFSAFLKTLISQNSTNIQYLNNKIKEPSRSVELISTKEQFNFIVELINGANAEIEAHNKIVENYESERNNLIKAIWKFITEDYKTEITSFKSKKDGLEKGISNLESQFKAKREEYRKLDVEIKNLSKNITSIQPTIDEINRLLKSYGFLNFEIVRAQEDGFYQIQREDGTIAESTLSEGEITFITFLYFLQLAKGGISQDEVNNERVLIVDDPISSLDSNVLFVVSTLLKDIIKSIKKDIGNIKQLILLTHNVYFHKEVSFIDGRTKTCNKTNYWILRKNDKITSLQNFEMENPIQSSYELLWQELKSNDIKSSLTIQNIMRRIIENYFKLLGKYGDDDLILNFDSKEDKQICRSLISWINDGSHSINDDLFVELQDRTIESYQRVFKDIFIKTNHEGHYNMMMGINE